VRRLGIVVLAALLTACSSPPRVEAPPPFPWDAPSPPPSVVDLDEIRPGGPPPDGIPPIDQPRYESVEQADGWLEDREPVLMVERGQTARAYPLRILTFHEIVNDQLDGDPLLVTYCPLCNSGLAFHPVVDGEVLDFGTSGRLWRSNLVMYDRATRSLWSQFTGEAIVGEHLGIRLERLPSAIVSWADFRSSRPGGDVLSIQTGFDRPYGRNPYVGYADRPVPLFAVDATDGRLGQLAPVVAITVHDDSLAVPVAALAEHRVVPARVGDRDVLVLWGSGTASALDTDVIAEGRDVGAAGVFAADLDGRSLRLRPTGDGVFTDEQTGSTFDVLGAALSGPLQGRRLERLPHDDTFWFVQYAFRPETRVWDE
jgi:hypothetical protein